MYVTENQPWLYSGKISLPPTPFSRHPVFLCSELSITSASCILSRMFLFNVAINIWILFCFLEILNIRVISNFMQTVLE